MSRLPVLSGQRLCKALEKIGYHVDHQKGERKSEIIEIDEFYSMYVLDIPSTYQAEMVLQSAQSNDTDKLFSDFYPDVLL